jgi:hypothetical protein
MNSKEYNVKKKIQIQTTTKCNGGCKICPYDNSMLAQQKADMTDEVFERIINQVNEYVTSIPKLALYMQAEPLFDIKIYDRIEMIFTKLKVPFEYLELSTNGSLLNSENRKKILAAINHTNTRFDISFHKSVQSEYEKFCKLDYEQTFFFVEQWLIESDSLRGVERRIITSDQEEIAYPFWQETFRMLKLKNPPKIMYIKTPTNRARAGNFIKGKDVKCPRISQWITFNWKGDIILCCSDYDNEFILGNIMENELPDIIGGFQYRVNCAAKDVNFICNRCDQKGV